MFGNDGSHFTYGLHIKLYFTLPALLYNYTEHYSSDKLPAAIELIPSFILLLSLNLAYCNDIKLLKVHSIRMNPWFLFSNLDEEDGNVDLDPSSFPAKEEECNLASSG